MFLKVPVVQKYRIVHTVTVAVEIGIGLETDYTDTLREVAAD